MIKILRRIVFFLFLAVFLIGAPKIVFYALGYSYHAGSEKGIVQTGLIYLSTTPPGATVYVGGRRYHEPTPAIIRDLLPGNYPIRLVLNEHDIWTKNVPVEAAKASVLGKILLHPKRPDWHRRIQGSFEDLTAIPETHYLLLKKSKEPGAIHVYNRKENKLATLFLEDARKELRLLNVYFVPGSTHVLLKAEGEGRKKWAWIDLDKADSAKIIWGEWFSFDPEKIIWAAKEPRFIFVFEKGALSRFDTEKKILAPFEAGVRGWGTDERKLLLLAADNHFVSADLLDKSRKDIFQNNGKAPFLFERQGFFEAERLADDLIFFKEDEGRLMVNQSAFPLVEKGALGFHFDKKHRKAVIWTKDAVGTSDFPKEKKDQDDSGARTTVDWVLRQAKDVRGAFWAHGGAYVIFQDQNKVLLLELETFGQPSLYELLETKGGSRVFYSDDSGELFYLDKKTGNLMSLEVVPKWKVLEIPFAVLQEKEAERRVAA